ncbi:MAG: adenylosuccinate lyase [Chloroflexi bacterium]|nr:adenylosuccinate lyase [Chloroflexota bacterium]
MIERYSRPAMKRVWSEENKFARWLQVELAVCEAWAELGQIPKSALPRLRRAKLDHARMGQILARTRHDMTAFLEAVAESLGQESRFIHLGLTSSDVMDTALALQMAEAADLLAQELASLLQALEARAVEHRDTIMMGRTHGMHAEPTTFGLKLALWVEELRRHAQSLAAARKAIAVGKISGAVGTYATVPPEVEERACARLGLEPAPVSSQIVPRDRHAQFVTTLALIASSLEKFATEIRNLQRTEVAEVEEPFAEGQTGSSAMPHKRNPELSERLCGLARLMRGYALTAMENVALWHERDISHSSAERIILPDSCLALDYMLATLSFVIRGLRVNRERMRQNLELTRGLVFSQRALLALIDKGLSRQEAYGLVQRGAMRSWREGLDFRELLKSDREIAAHLAKSELEALFDYGFYLRYSREAFRRLGLEEKAPTKAKARPNRAARKGNRKTL